jgi:hypothetical protein
LRRGVFAVAARSDANMRKIAALRLSFGLRIASS